MLLTRKELTAQRRLYRNMIKEHPAPWCWACGRTGGFTDRPADWHAPWWIERCHIVNKPRVEDRRLVILLCSLCHQHSGGAKIVTASRPIDWPKIRTGSALWLKQKFDAEFFDLDFLRSHSIGNLPEAIEPHSVYLTEYRGRHPG